MIATAPQDQPITLTCRDFYEAAYEAGDHDASALGEDFCYCDIRHLADSLDPNSINPTCPTCGRLNCNHHHPRDKEERNCLDIRRVDLGDVVLELCCFCADKIAFEISGPSDETTLDEWRKAANEALATRERICAG